MGWTFEVVEALQASPVLARKDVAAKAVRPIASVSDQEAKSSPAASLFFSYNLSIAVTISSYPLGGCRRRAVTRERFATQRMAVLAGERNGSELKVFSQRFLVE